MKTLQEPSVESARKTSSGTAPDWDEGESYQTGSDKKRQRMEIFVTWLLTPESEREPRTRTELGELLNVSLQTLRNYEREPYVQRELTERARSAFRVVALPDVIDHLSKIATGQQGRYPGKESPAAAVSAGKTLLDWVEKTRDIREETVDLEDLTEAELVQLALQILQGQAKSD